MGEFRFGSTMVMVSMGWVPDSYVIIKNGHFFFKVFEAPENFEFCLIPGDVVKYGQQVMIDMSQQ
jgi:hypothetical protein